MLVTRRLAAVLLTTAALGGTTLVAPAPASAATLGDRIVAEGLRHQGKPYQWAAVGPSRFDCSGYTLYVLKRLGRSLPHNSAMQYNAVQHIAAGSKRPGDLIFTKRDGKIRHVGIYVGGTTMLASVQSGDVVRKQSLSGRTLVFGRVS